jgi:hypothetical protein
MKKLLNLSISRELVGLTKKVSTTVAQETERKAGLIQERGDPKVSTRKVAFGTIKEQMTASYQGKKSLQIRVLIDKEYDLFFQADPRAWYGLAYPVDVIAHIYGDNLVNRRVKIEYSTIYPDNGIATIVGDKNFFGDLDKAMEIAPMGTLLSPAGSAF